MKSNRFDIDYILLAKNNEFDDLTYKVNKTLKRKVTLGTFANQWLSAVSLRASSHFSPPTHRKNLLAGWSAVSLSACADLIFSMLKKPVCACDKSCSIPFSMAKTLTEGVQ